MTDEKPANSPNASLENRSPSDVLEKSDETPAKKSIFDVQVEGKRQRSQVHRLAIPVATPKTKKMPISGHGTPLGDIEYVRAFLDKRTHDELKKIHRLLFKTDGKKRDSKKDIRSFNGFAFDKDSAEYKKKLDDLHKWTMHELRFIKNLIGLQFTAEHAATTKDALAEAVLGYLMCPVDIGRKVPSKKRASGAAQKSRQSSKGDGPKAKTNKKTGETGRDESEDSDDDYDEEETTKKSTSTKRKAGGKKAAVESDDDENNKDNGDAGDGNDDEKDNEPKKKAPKKRKAVSAEEVLDEGSEDEPSKPKPKKRRVVEDDKSEENNENSQSDESIDDEDPLPNPYADADPGNIDKTIEVLLKESNPETTTLRLICEKVIEIHPGVEADMPSLKAKVKRHLQEKSRE